MCVCFSLAPHYTLGCGRCWLNFAASQTHFQPLKMSSGLICSTARSYTHFLLLHIHITHTVCLFTLLVKFFFFFFLPLGRWSRGSPAELWLHMFLNFLILILKLFLHLHLRFSILVSLMIALSYHLLNLHHHFQLFLICFLILSALLLLFIFFILLFLAFLFSHSWYYFLLYFLFSISNLLLEHIYLL